MSYPLEKYIPKCQIKTSRRIPWITHAIKLKMKERKQLYDGARNTQTHQTWKAYIIILSHDEKLNNLRNI